MSSEPQEENEQFNLRWNHFQTSLSGGLFDLMQEQAFVDVTLACEDQFVQAHKNVLSVCSPYFKALFKANPCKHPIVILRDVRLSDLRALLTFMYRGEVNVNEEELPGLLRTAELLNIRGLTGINKGFLKQDKKQDTTPTTNVKCSTTSTPEPPKKKLKKQESFPAPPTSFPPSVESLAGPLEMSEIKLENQEVLEFLEIDPTLPDTPILINKFVSSHPYADPLSLTPQPSAMEGPSSSQDPTPSRPSAEDRIASLLESQHKKMEEMTQQQNVFSQLLASISVPNQLGVIGQIPTMSHMSHQLATSALLPEQQVRLAGSNIQVAVSSFNSFNRSKFTLFVNDLSTHLFGNEVLRTSNLTGKPSRLTKHNKQKAKLDPLKVDAIIKQTIREFPGVTASQVRHTIRSKCQNLCGVNSAFNKSLAKQSSLNESGQEFGEGESTDDETSCQ